MTLRILDSLLLDAGIWEKIFIDSKRSECQTVIMTL